MVEQAIRHIDIEALIETLDRLVRVPSLDGTPEEITVQALMADIMRELGMDVDQYEIDFDALSQHPSYSAEVDRASGIGVLGHFGDPKGQGKTLLLNGHLDVVPAGNHANWPVDPWRVTVDQETGRVYGRGALDMKGGLCCALYAMKAIRDAGIELDGELLIQPVIGEEDGGSGALAAVLHLKECDIQPDGAIIMEPTEMMVSPAQAGCFNFRVTLTGRAAHGAMRNEGVDPLEKFMLVYQAILSFERMRNTNVTHPMFSGYELPYPICVGTLRAGVWASTVPESLTFEGRYGIKVDEDPEDARAAFEKIIAQVAAADPWLQEHPPQVEWWGGQFKPAEIPVTHPLVETVSAAYQATAGEQPILKGMTYGADMRLLVLDGGIPTLMFGPGDIRKAHTPDEYVPIEDLRTVTETLVRTILAYCGTK